MWTRRFLTAQGRAVTPLHCIGGGTAPSKWSTTDFSPHFFHATPIGLMLKSRIQGDTVSRCPPPPPVPPPMSNANARIHDACLVHLVPAHRTQPTQPATVVDRLLQLLTGCCSCWQVAAAVGRLPQLLVGCCSWWL